VRLPDEVLSLTQKAQKAQNARIASLACDLPDVINDDDNQNENLSQSDFHRSEASLTAATQLSPLQSNFNRAAGTLTAASLPSHRYRTAKGCFSPSQRDFPRHVVALTEASLLSPQL
jgi:hypothetical protein